MADTDAAQIGDVKAGFVAAKADVNERAVQPGGTTGQLYAKASNVDYDGIWVSAGSGSGDVVGPVANTADYVPQWSGANSKTLKDGRAIGAASSADLIDRAAGDARYATPASVALKADIASPTFTGIPAAPTATAGTSTTQLATTAFVTTADNLKAPLNSPALTGIPTAPTAAVATNTTQIATTAFVLANAGGGGGGTPSTIQVFSVSGTYTKPAGVRNLYIVAIGGGGGGGSGRRGATSTARSGGGGGGGGGWSDRTIDASLIGATETVTIGAAGVGGAAITVDDTNGNLGTNGGNTSFGSWVMANGGLAHPSAAATTALSATTAMGGVGGISGGVGGGTGVSSTPVMLTRTSGVAPGGGGGGAGFATNNGRIDGRAGADTGTGAPVGSGGTYTAGVAGGNGSGFVSGDTAGGGGGGGGGDIAAANGLNGGTGIGGGGGGGGGAALNGNNSGAGGNGGAGYLIVFETY